LWGNACDLNALKVLCERHNLVLIEDCAQAFGCTYQGHPIGTVGDMGCFSFNEFKHISCGDGGLVLTSDARLAKRLRLATDKCYNRRADAVVRDPTFLAPNYRMTELQSAVALAQLKKLDSIVERRRDWCNRLNSELENLPGLQTPQATPGCDPSWWFYMLRVVPEELGADASTFAGALSAEGLPAAAGYIGRPIYEYPIFQEHSAFERGGHAYTTRTYARGDCPTTEAILRTCVKLAVNEAYTQTDLEETLHAFRRVVTWFRRGR
jgi:perosamine synthetase